MRHLLHRHLRLLLNHRALPRPIGRGSAPHPHSALRRRPERSRKRGRDDPRAAAVRAGASRQEAAEAIGVTFLMKGGPATIYGPRAYDAFCEFADATVPAQA